MGLLRRAMLEAGRRLGLHRPEHAVELTVDELVAGLTGGSLPDRRDGRGPGSGSARAAPRSTRRGSSDRSSPSHRSPPCPDRCPDRRRPVGDRRPHARPTTAAAVGIGDRPHTGRALVVDDPNEALDLVEPGDVVITTATSPSWNVVLVQAGALVTTTGGLLSHAAVIARELGIPALIGEPTAMRRVTTGSMVTVDPVAGVLTVDELAVPTRSER